MKAAQRTTKRKDPTKRSNSVTEHNPEGFLRSKMTAIDPELLRTIEHVRKIASEAHTAGNQEEIILSATSHA